MCSPVRRTCGPTSWLRRSARPSTSSSGWRRTRRRRSGTSTSEEGSASPTSRRTRRWIWPRSEPTWPSCCETKIRVQLPEARVVIELGRYIVGECGVYVTRIVDRKESRGRTFLVVDGGLHHQLAASGNFGQVIRRNYPIAIGNRMDEEAAETVTVVGKLCTPLDLLGDRVTLPPADCRGSGRGFSGRSLRVHGQPDCLPEPPGARRGPFVEPPATPEPMHWSPRFTANHRLSEGAAHGHDYINVR